MDEGLSSEPSNALLLNPLRTPYPILVRIDVENLLGFADFRDSTNLPRPNRDSARTSICLIPDKTRVLDRRSGAGYEMETLRLIGTFRTHGAGVAAVTGLGEPDATERDLRARGKP
tara:strand:+ start:21993 stop:22340 length:348 start_codon:yes stop_codon:yes gene_type:complete